jgi:hypothetical protein
MVCKFLGRHRQKKQIKGLNGLGLSAENSSTVENYQRKLHLGMTKVGNGLRGYKRLMFEYKT